MAAGQLIPGSQYGEDVVINAIFKGKRGGCAIDVGSADGLHHSNLYNLITHKGWRALMIEPHPILFRECAKRYNSVNGVICVNCAIKEYRGTCDFYMYGSSYHGQVSTTVDAFRDLVISQHGDKYAKSITVFCSPIDKLMNEFIEDDINNVSFVNLDCEGAEIEAIRTYPFNVSRPTLFCIEFATNEEDLHKEMINNDYRLLPVDRRRYKNVFYCPQEEYKECTKKILTI